MNIKQNKAGRKRRDYRGSSSSAIKSFLPQIHSWLSTATATPLWAAFISRSHASRLFSAARPMSVTSNTPSSNDAIIVDAICNRSSTRDKPLTWKQKLIEGICGTDCKADSAGRVAQRHVVRGINIVGDLEIPSPLRFPRDDHVHRCKELCGVLGKKKRPDDRSGQLTFVCPPLTNASPARRNASPTSHVPLGTTRKNSRTRKALWVTNLPDQLIRQTVK